jgi:hypothetical protein
LIPYGVWVEPDGREILFNRWYVAIWQRYPGQSPTPADPLTWANIAAERWFYDDATENKRAAGEAVLREWGLPVNPFPRAAWGHFPKGQDPMRSEARWIKNKAKRTG